MVSAIVVAAGRGKRLKSKISKALIRLNNKPLFIYSLEKFNSISLIGEIIVVGQKKDLTAIKSAIKKYRLNKVKSVIVGGNERYNSVRNGIKELNVNSRLVLIHDAARPFITDDVIVSVINAAKKYGAAIVGVPIKPTIKKATKENFVKNTIPREDIWEIQTPQVFRKDIILKAYNKLCDKCITDDSMLVERLGVRVKVVNGLYSNIKITSPEDLIIARAILKNV